jgi:replication-associated recombination protein RarA
VVSTHGASVSGGSLDLVISYDAPGVGQLTVATALARLTGYRLFDNHI